MKFYAVKVGTVPGIYTSWEECEANVKGYPGAIYKSFKSENEANAFMDGDGYQIKKEDSPLVLTHPVAYVDGSFNEERKLCGLGVIILYPDGTFHHFESYRSTPELVEMRNVGGEITAAEEAMYFAREVGIKDLTIYHDYEGIANWCLGTWKANKFPTQDYIRQFNYYRQTMNIDFVHVKGHSNDKYNDIVDALAKRAIGLPYTASIIQDLPVRGKTQALLNFVLMNPRQEDYPGR